MNETRIGPFSQVIDLTQPLSEDMPLWPGDPPTEITPWAYLATEGYRLGRLAVGEHSGTHLGAPAHLSPAGLTVDRLPPGRLVLPACVLDFRSRAARDADAVVCAGDIESWERRHGAFVGDSIVLLHTGWSERWRDAATYFNSDASGRMHFPGFGLDAVRFLVEERDVAGLGSDAAGIDAGADTALSANRLLLAGRRFHLENLTNLEQLPPKGAWLVLGALPIVCGSGAPARVLALIP